MKQKLFVIKIGGNILDNPVALHEFLDELSAIDEQIVLIHGGGKIATAMSQKLGIATTMIEGRRVTDAASLDVTVMVYAGLMNKKVVAYLQSKNINAIGVCGADWNLIPSVKRPINNGIDYGFVGDVVAPMPLGNWQLLLQNKTMPIVAPITHDGNGQLLNTNADTIASTVAIGLSESYEVHLVYCFEKPGVLRDANDDTSVINTIATNEFYKYIEDGIVTDGMIPKLQNAVDAIQSGVSTVRIGLAKNITSLLKGTSGTVIHHAN
jgi:acetylglutamate kinase